jgi:hypothetical protein
MIDKADSECPEVELNELQFLALVDCVTKANYAAAEALFVHHCSVSN